MLKQFAYKFRLKPNERQARQMAQFAGCQRKIWNHVLAEQQARQKEGLAVQGHYDMRPSYYQLRQGHSFLSEAPQESADFTLGFLHRAFKDAFDRTSPRRFPRFKARGQKDSFRIGFTQKNACKLDQNNHRIYLPKIGWVRYFKNHKVLGTIKNATVSITSGHWDVSIQVEMEVPEPVHPSTSEVGIDVGISKMAVCSDGKIFEPLNSFKRHERQLARVQRRLSRKVGPDKKRGRKPLITGRSSAKSYGGFTPELRTFARTITTRSPRS